MIRRYAITAILMLLTVAFCTPFFVHAQGLPGTGPIVPPDCTGPGGCQTICDIPILMQNILNAAVVLAVLSTVFWFVYDGYLFLRASWSGETASLVSAKKLLKHVVFGIAGILLAYAAVDLLVSSIVGVASGFSWNKIC